MKPVLKKSLTVIVALFIGGAAGFSLTGSRVFEPATQYFHFIFVPGILVLIWNLAERKKRIIALAVTFASLEIFTGGWNRQAALRDLIYYVSFFLSAEIYFPLINRIRHLRPVYRFFVSPVSGAAAYVVAGGVLYLFFPSVLSFKGQLEISLYYGLVIGAAAGLASELMLIIPEAEDVSGID